MRLWVIPFMVTAVPGAGVTYETFGAASAWAVGVSVVGFWAWIGRRCVWVLEEVSDGQTWVSVRPHAFAARRTRLVLDGGGSFSLKHWAHNGKTLKGELENDYVNSLLSDWHEKIAEHRRAENARKMLVENV